MANLILGRLFLGYGNAIFNKMGRVPSQFLGFDAIDITVVYNSD